MANQPLFASSDRLLELMRISQDDILANRAGRLGARQHRNLVRTARLLALGTLALGGFLIAGGFMSRANGGQSFVPWLFGGLIVVIGLVLAWGSRTAGRNPVRCLTGDVEVALVQSGRTAEVRLLIAGEQCPLPTRLAPSVGPWRTAIDAERRYHVYVIGPLNHVVGVEIA